MRKLALLLLIALLASTAPASAKTWETDYSKSSLGFIGKQGDEVIKGRFKNFQATINFDPANPTFSKITASIDITSVLTGSNDVDTSLPQSDWFDSKKFPKAEFTTTFIEADTKPSCYKATGNLTLKGISKEILLPFCLTQEGDHMHAKGEFTLMRNNFEIGIGQWADEGMVANAVTVTVDIVAK